jgi:hypothetical protein
VDITFLAGSGDVVAFEGDALVARVLHFGAHPAIEVTVRAFGQAIEEQEKTALAVLAVCSSSR